jgi:hypothetical protein
VYDDYDNYASDGYQNEEDGWSPGEYFSPEGIKGRWAGELPDGRAGGRGRPGSSAAADRDPFGSGRDPFDTAFDSSGRGRGDSRGGGYGADEYATGAYDLPEGADSPERGRRRRRDREDRGERTGILPRLRRDRGEDIWPDDGISDEDYWASVAADRPLNGADSPLDDERGPAGGAPRRTAAPGPGDQRGGDQRGVTGRLGPPPGLAGDYQPGNMTGSGPMPRAGEPGGGARASGPMPRAGQPGARTSGGQLAIGQPGDGSRTSGPMSRAGQPGARTGGQLAIGQPGGGSRTSSGPIPVRPGTGPAPVRSATGPTPARSATGPTPARPATGPIPTVGVTASRPPAGPNGMRPGPGTGPSPAWPGQAQQRPGSASGAFPQSPPRPSFQPNGFQPGGGSAGRQYDRGDWGDRTERIERVSVHGYPDQRPGGRGPAGPGTGGPSGAPGRGRDDSGGWRTPDRREADRREADRREADRREADRREGGRDSGGWPVSSRGGVPAWNGANDDPLTSQAYSQAALTDTDGRSYRVAARRSQAQAVLTEQVESFITGQYQSVHTGDYPTATFQPADQRTGEYRQYRDEAPGTAGQAATGRLPAYGSQDGRQANGHPAQPARAIGGPADSGSVTSGWPAQPASPGGQYDGQWQAQQPRPQAQAPAPLPAMPLSAPVPSGNATGSSPVAQPGGRAPAKGGLNPYDVAITGSYPYPGQAFPSALPGPSQSGPSPSGPSSSGPSQSGADDPYYRPLPADGYPSGGGDPGRSDPARAGYGASYANGYQDPRDRRY